jgi:hypothetical protein
VTIAAVGVKSDQVADSQSISLPEVIRRFAPLIIVVMVFAVAASAAIPYPVGIFHDDGVYLILGKALASGEGYRYLHLPGAPLATHYPPAYPLLLAALWKLAPDFPANVSLLLLVNAALLAMTAWAIERFTRSRLGWPRWLAAAGAIAGTLSMPLLLLSSVVMSEVLFIALAILLLGTSERALEETATRPARDLWLGAATGALTLVRAQAIALPLAVIALFLLERQWRRAAWCAAAVMLVMLPWQLWVAVHDSLLAGPLRGSYGSYLRWYGRGLASGGVAFVWHTAATNIVEVTSLIADRVAPWPYGWMRLTALTLVIGLLIAGAVGLRRRAPVTLAFVVLYFGVTLAWPYAPWRFVFAIWPLVLVLGIEGALAVAAFRPRRWPNAWRVGSVALIALVTTGIARAELGTYRERAWRTPVREAQRQIAPLVRWVADHTTPSDVVIADDEPLVYLMTGRLALPPASFTASEYVQPFAWSQSTSERTIRTLIDEYHPHYFLTVVPSTRDAARSLARAPHRPLLREIGALGAGAVFDVTRP